MGSTTSFLSLIFIFPICFPKPRAAHEKWGDSIREYQCVDVSQDMNNMSEYLLRGNLLCLS